MKRFIPTSLLALALAGCSGAPSDNDIKTALQAERQRALAGAEATVGKGPAAEMVRAMSAELMPEVVSAHKLGCKEDGENAYRCDVEIEFKQGGKVVKAPPASLRLVKGSDGWAAQR